MGEPGISQSDSVRLHHPEPVKIDPKYESAHDYLGMAYLD